MNPISTKPRQKGIPGDKTLGEQGARISAAISQLAEACSQPPTKELGRLRTLLDSSLEIDDPLRRDAAVVQAVVEFTQAVWCGLFQIKHPDGLALRAEQNGMGDQKFGVLHSSLMSVAERAIKENELTILEDEFTVIASPIRDANQHTYAVICMLLNLGRGSIEPFTLVAELTASVLEKQNSVDTHERLANQVEITAAVAELAQGIARCDSLESSANWICNSIRNFTGAKTVAVAFAKRPGALAKLVSLSGVDHPGNSGLFSQNIEEALNECYTQNEAIQFPQDQDQNSKPEPDSSRPILVNHRQLFESAPATNIISVPLRDQYHDAVGAILIQVDAASTESTKQFANVCIDFVGNQIEVKRHATDSLVRHASRSTQNLLRSRAFFTVVVAAIAFGLLMFLPVNHEVPCVCQLKPAMQSFVVAPVNGILLRCLVSPGDAVEQGQVIAILDDRELTMERSRLLARREAANRNLDIHLSGGQAADVKLAELEVKQIEADLDIIRINLTKHQVRSPITGIVLQCPVEDAQNAPMSKGDELMRIAPLDRYQVSLLVPESDIRFIKPDATVFARFEGYPDDRVETRIEIIQPDSQIWNHQVVFECRGNIVDPEGHLRPGIQGRAVIQNGRRSLGWTLFGRPWERIKNWL